MGSGALEKRGKNQCSESESEDGACGEGTDDEVFGETPNTAGETPALPETYRIARRRASLVRGVK